jgi:hypothetical protein
MVVIMKTVWMPLGIPIQQQFKPLTRCQVLGICQSITKPGCTLGCRKIPIIKKYPRKDKS